LIEPHSLVRAKRSGFRVKLAWTGALLFLSSLGLLGLSEWLALPRWFALVVGAVFFTGAFLVIGLGLSTTTEVKRVALSAVQVDQLDKWWQFGELVTLLEGLSQGQALKLADVTRKNFGKFVVRKVVGKNGKTWTFTQPRVGLKTQVAGYYDGNLRFSVILYRRDLARVNRIPRPWRRISKRDGTIQFMSPSQTVELPSWIA
jgi:hypothetical protein